MLMRIDIKNRMTCVAEIADNNSDTVSETLQLIGCPEYTIGLKYDHTDLNIDQEYPLYDFDNIATVMVEKNKPDMFSVDLDEDGVEQIGIISITNEPVIFLQF